MKDPHIKAIGPLVEYKIADQALALAERICIGGSGSRYLDAMMAVEAYNAACINADTFSLALSRCESEIEKMLMVALFSVARAAENTTFLLSEWDFRELEKSQLGTFIEPQFKIDKYRADFRLIYVDHKPDWENKREHNGQMIPGFKTVRSEILIECDGHDFHERTKEQARRDRARDREFQRLGYKVFRFTGSEIFADPIRCANEAIQAVGGPIHETISEEDLAVFNASISEFKKGQRA